jgi:hypothetical protein
MIVIFYFLKTAKCNKYSIICLYFYIFCAVNHTLNKSPSYFYDGLLNKNEAKSSFLVYFQPVTSAMALPSSAGLATVFTPAASRAANFSAAVPLPPEIIAPA